MLKDEETLEKLFAERQTVPTNAIGILNVPNKKRIEYLDQLAQRLTKVENSLLIFKTNSTGKNQAYFDEVYAYLYKYNQLVAIKKASVSEIGGTLFMHAEQKI